MRFSIKTWFKDPLIQRVLRNTGYLFSSSAISMGLTSLQGILAALLLGPAGYGTLGIIILYATTVNRLFSFRMGELVVKYAGESLATGNQTLAAAVIKAAGLAEAITSITAYALLALTAPLAAVIFVKDATTAPWIIIYGLALLANLMTETSTAVLQIGDHFRSQAFINLFQSILTAAWIGIAYLTHGDVFQILCAYLAGKTLSGVGITAFAFRWLKPMLGEKWWKAPLSLIPDKWAMIKFSISTNLSGTVNMVIKDSEVLWAGFFFSNLEAGYYKFALSLMNIVLIPINQFITTTFPEITSSVARKDWKKLRSLLQRTTAIALVWTVSCVLGLLVLGQWGLGLLKNGAYLPSYPAILILLLGYGVANIFFWNRPLMLAFGQPNYPLKITTLVGLVKTGLMFVLVKPFGFLAQAALLSGYFIVSVAFIVRRGLNLVKTAESGTKESLS